MQRMVGVAVVFILVLLSARIFANSFPFPLRAYEDVLHWGIKVILSFYFSLLPLVSTVHYEDCVDKVTLLMI